MVNKELLIKQLYFTPNPKQLQTTPNSKLQTHSLSTPFPHIQQNLYFPVISAYLCGDLAVPALQASFHATGNLNSAPAYESF